jgi:ATP-dependent RNA circularization protein (DNA/RNA ligase family)
MKYPRTMYLPWSLSKSENQTVSKDSPIFTNHVIITEKMDGENTSFHTDKTHARSLDSRYHPSRSFATNVWAKIAHLLPKNLQVFCENMYAIHSITYNSLTGEDICLVFGMLDKNTNKFLSWKDTVDLAEVLGLKTVPVLESFPNGIPTGWTPKNSVSEYGAEREGFVVRLAHSFFYNKFNMSCAKWVRKNHVQTDIHWTKKWKPAI